jgi:hypothetical protein
MKQSNHPIEPVQNATDGHSKSEEKKNHGRCLNHNRRLSLLQLINSR